MLEAFVMNYGPTITNVAPQQSKEQLMLLEQASRYTPESTKTSGLLEKAVAPTLSELLVEMPQDGEAFERLSLSLRPIDL